MPSTKPWKTTRLHTVHRNKYFSIRQDDVVCPDGTHSTYSYIVSRGGVGIVPVDDSLNVTLIREYKYPIRAVGIHTVSGHIEQGESPMTAARRELREESGITAHKWQSLGRIAASDGISSEYGHIFLARHTTSHTRTADPKEPITILRMPLREAVEMVIDGRITCSYAIVGIMRAAAILRVITVK